MVYYRCIVGSRLYGIALADSDTDLFLVTDGGLGSGLCGRRHRIVYNPKGFCKQIPLPCRNELARKISWMFPEKMLADTALSRLVLQTREEIVRAARPEIYRAFLQEADGLSVRLREMYPEFPKRAAYSCLFYDMIIRYAQGASFYEAHRPEEELRQWLLAVRRREIDIDEIVQKNEQLRKKAVAAGRFYDGKMDEGYLESVGAGMRELLGIDKN